MRRLGIFLAVLVSCSISAGVRAQSGFDSNGQCVGDADGDGTVAINEIIIAVNNALSQCPMPRPREASGRSRRSHLGEALLGWLA